ncbi:MAG: hypothetical protein GX662_08465 [Trichococcus flocculiformis]|uniref:Phage conserved hypothetical protein C-terminal domain-containing protein n=1 Tax=Trichococcus flocculiformis TaxID=82803 RepID=A0A847D6L6_9LACT|nr:conserved phage C-terminal domain-containing protein [Trichococcus flocculiformis]NLD32275.1 hypothetical protein [Trichococcus flocculiformis]
MADSEKGALLPEILKDGYGYSPKKITRDASLSIEAKAIYAYLASFADEEGKAYPGIELMCHELNISEKRFHRHKKQLIDQGFITLERERTDNGWSNNIYTLVGYSVTSHFVPLRNVPLRNVPLQIVTLQNDPTIITSLNNTSLINTKLNKKELVEQKPDPIPYREIIDYLNQKAGKSFKHSAAGNKKVIKARWNEGYKLDQFKRVVDNKCQDWLNDEKMSQYLQPSTLFGNKFDQYLNQRKGNSNGAPQKSEEALMMDELSRRRMADMPKVDPSEFF